ncbi:MAG: hypothetical protein ACR2M1_10505 [Gemmatimonadaceae bacterium]
MAKMLTVAATGDDKHVLLFETDAEHPDGEAFLYADSSVETKVARTPAVMSLLRSGAIQEVGASEPTAAQKKAQEKAKAESDQNLKDDEAARVEQALKDAERAAK